MPIGPSPRLEELLDELVAIFLAEGFRSFTLSDLAERLRCSKSTLYGLGRSKEQLRVNVVVRFFRTATAFVEAATAEREEPGERIVAYLAAVADALRPASAGFMSDLATDPATRVVYERNTALAAERIGELVREGTDAGAFRDVHGVFVADLVAAEMTRIQTGAVAAATGLRDADAYDALAALVVSGIRADDALLSAAPSAARRRA